MVWHLASAGMSIEEIVEELAKHPNGIGAKYAKRLFAEVTRCFNKWKKHRVVSVGMVGAVGSGSGIGTASVVVGAMNWPQIKVIPSELPRIVNEAEDALLLSEIELYQRGGMLVRPVKGTIVNKDGKTEGWHLIQVVHPYLVESLCCAAQFVRMDSRGKVKGWKPIDAPDKVASALLSRRGKWKLPVLNGIVQAPFLRIDGSLCETPGYDPASKLLFKADEVFPPIPQCPSRDDALKALEHARGSDRHVPVCQQRRPLGGAGGHPYEPGSTFDGDGAAVRLQQSGRGHGKVEAGRPVLDPGHRPADVCDLAGLFGG